MAEKHHVVVDGSNLATEGRTSPSLRQLDEAVKAYALEDPTAEIVVVVDATFGHRIDPSERNQFDQAELHGELVSPPAGAIGRGDAFVLRIAERTGATVLSNDSFQEFHAEHPWLFDLDRLVGGKPVPGVGWIFTPRSPVRGPRSRQVTGKAKKEDRSAELPAPVKAAELAKAAKRVARKVAATTDGAPPKIGDVREASSTRTKRVSPPKMAEPVPIEAPKSPKKGAAKKASKSASAELAAEGAKPAKKQKPAKVQAAAKVAKKAKKAPASKKAAKAAAGTAGAKKPKAAAPAAKKKATKKAAATKATKATRAAKTAKTAKNAKNAKNASKATVTTSSPRSSAQPRSRAAARSVVESDAAASDAPAADTAAPTGSVTPIDPQVLEAINKATAEALSPPARKAKDRKRSTKNEKASDKAAKRRRSVPPLPAVNEPLPFINFVAAYPLGSEVEGEVASFTSHGAMIEVDVPGGESVHCYVPLAGLGEPPPRKAREVLSRGQHRTFVLVSLDPARRVAELALPEAATNLARAAGG